MQCLHGLHRVQYMTPDLFTQQGRMRALGPKVSRAAGGDFIRVLSDDPFSSYFPRDVIR